ncbi:MAG: hypothetical protein GXY36_19980 [Chloroflexi bacterium]|nr:hypothetical protein [Chloroflexota bacterium]
MNTDLDLLRQYEPVIRYTYGEHFFPLDVEPYIEHSSLWLRGRDMPPEELVARGQLTPELLTEIVPEFPNSTLYLQFVEPLTGRMLQKFLTRRDRPRFRARGRLARVGLSARIVDALFSITLLLRGTVPGGTAAAAEEAYQQLLARAQRYTYYGRVVRQDNYIVLHYLYFYYMNDWRSSFFGVNDHEGDWEQVFVYLQVCEGKPPAPAWVAYASHDYHGDNRRRRWDDPELEKVGTHPVVYAGAGSHAAYFAPGEYLVTVSLAGLRPVIRVLEAAQRFWRLTLRQGDPTAAPPDIAALLRIPFVDYARGDGVSIGPGGLKSWTPVLLDPAPGWVMDYRGLWGFYARDPVSGENAPAGPKFNRDGTVRRTWHNPLGWSGLQKVEPTDCRDTILVKRIADLEAEQERDRAQALVQRERLAGMHAQARAVADQPHLQKAYKAAWIEVEQQEAALNALYDTLAERDEVLRASRQRLAEIEAGHSEPPRAHLVHPPRPQSEEEIRMSGLAESWAAFSVGLLLVSTIVLYLAAENWLISLALLMGVFGLLEAIFSRRFERLIVGVTVLLSIAAGLILLYEFFWEVVVGGIVAIGLMIIVDNLREIRA